MTRSAGTNPSMGYTVRGGTTAPDVYKPGEPRFYDAEEYRRKIQYYKDLRKKRRAEKNKSKTE